jgi:hypothetical protein
VAAEVAHAGDDHSIPAVRAVFVLAPALVQALYPTSLAQMRMPVAIVLGDADTVAPPTTNGLVAAKLIPGADWNKFLASDTMISCPPAPKLDGRSFHNARPIFPRPIPTAMQSRQLRNSLVGTLRTIRDRAADRHKGAAAECPRAPTLPPPHARRQGWGCRWPSRSPSRALPLRSHTAPRNRSTSNSEATVRAGRGNP